jgi:acyl transferase domain-containing protein/NAD(P)-dependent dehydrogenase (short-subunit alcohol dehydrogenase family)/acyl carrier protein
MQEATDVLGHGDCVEPLAIVGIGCRYAGGANNPESFWRLLLSGVDAVSEIPPDRWNLKRFYDPDPAKPGKIYTREGGFLEQKIDAFDALFFGIAPREAECMDPQQRLLLETSWEALEDAGIPAESIAGSNTGVFIGAFTLDHKLTQMGGANRDYITTHTAIGSTMTILSNRISYMLDLHGPSMSLDTACSSSLVATHLGCQAIWRGECDMALVGGVNIMTRPEYPVAMCKGGFLAPDGRSKSFDASANGYGRGEGAGIVVLKRLSAALKDGDSVYAMVRGTGVNQDGRTNGITVPNPEAQAALIHKVCDTYKIDPHKIFYFEAHGTGTPVGDPVEAQALGAVVGQGLTRKDACLVGSVKSTIGHTEAAAGVAGMIKTALCLAHRQVPPQANLKEPNPNIPFEDLGLRLPRKLEKLALESNQVFAGINSFGYGGTNAHVILENAPARTDLAARKIQDNEAPYILPLSARSESGLTALAQAWLDRFPENNSLSLNDLCYSASCRRSHHHYRTAIVGNTFAEMRVQLDQFVTQGTGEWLANGRTIDSGIKQPVFVYTGMGPQWWAMGRELYATESVFKAAVDSCDALFCKLSGWSILDEMLADEEKSRMTETTVAQPANFVLQVGLTALLRAQGVEPAAIVGHSVGEVTAAYVSGVLTLEDAVKVSYYRSQIQNKAAGRGQMLAVGMDLEKCEELLELTENTVSIAAINSPTSITLAGESRSVQALSTYLSAVNIFNRLLKVEVAYHSHFMDELKAEVREKLADLKPALPKIPLYSTVTGESVKTVAYDAEYWCDNIREPVYFAKAMKHLLRDGHRLFLEIGPHPVLSTAIGECSSENKITARNVAIMKRGAPEQLTFKLGLAGLYTAGYDLDWKRMYAGNEQYIKLPTYPWQREIYWYEQNDSLSDRISAPVHPLLDQRLRDPRPAWQGALNHQFIPFLQDHQVDSLVVMPGAAYIEAGLAAYYEVAGDKTSICSMENIRFHQALILESISDPIIHINLDSETGKYSFFSKEREDPANWQLHASGVVKEWKSDGNNKGNGRQAANRLEKISNRCDEHVDIDLLYSSLATRGLTYGPCFQTIRQINRGKNEVLARIELHDHLLDDLPAYYLHPCLLDGCFQSLITLVDDSACFYMPVSIGKITYHNPPGKLLWCHGRLVQKDKKGIRGSLFLYGASGDLCVEIDNLFCRALQTKQEESVARLAEYAYTWKWRQQAIEAENNRSGSWVVFADNSDVCNALCAQLEVEPGNIVFQIKSADIYQTSDPAIRALDSDQIHHLRTILEYVKDRNCAGIVYLWGLNASGAAGDPAGVGQTSVALQILQIVEEVFTPASPRLYFVTRDTHLVKENDKLNNLAQSSLVGLARVAHNEFPALKCSLIDIDGRHVESSAAQLIIELLSNNTEDDVAFRGSQRFVHRLVHVEIPDDYFRHQTLSINGAQVEAFQLSDDFAFKATSRIRPKAHEVEIAVDHVCLDGAATDPDGENTVTGYLATGRVCRTGRRVSQLNKNDRVIIAAQGMPASHCTLPVTQVFTVTDPLKDMAPADLVALAASLLPAYYLLRHLMNISSGETLLIDAQSGLSVSALLEISKWLNADLTFYSADDAQIRALESRHGLNVLDARKVDFADSLGKKGQSAEIGAWIHVDSVETDFPALIFSAMREIVITQDSILQRASSNKLGMILFQPDGLTMALSSPALFARLLSEIAGYLSENALSRAVSYPLSPKQLSAEPALNHFQTPVISFSDKTEISVLMGDDGYRLDAGASYLITGGFGGFGLETANWLVKHGARYLVLASRRGATTDAAKTVLAALKKQDVHVMEALVDIADEVQVTQLLNKIRQAFPPLKGILHTAAILHDAPIRDLNPYRISTVMQAKAIGAWNLHRLTAGMALDFFVLFSSVSALIGNGRQANYSAANTFLDALACHRQANGLPATSINWGAISTGMAMESDEVSKHLENMGITPLDAAQSLDLWASMRNMKLAQYGLMNTDWSRWREFEPMGGNSPRFSELMPSSGAADSQMTGICQEISRLPKHERIAAMSAAFQAQIGKTLRIPVEKIEMQHSLTQLGVDSLMAAELQTAIFQTFGVRISTLELLRGQSLSLIVEAIFEKTKLAGNAMAENTDGMKDSLVDRLSEEDVDALLKQLMS